MNDNTRNHLIDLMRFLAALWVAFYHFNQPIGYIDNWYRNFLKLGYLGVPVFFVISGYCVTLSALHAQGWKDFIIRRLFRIFPPYYFSLIMVLLAVFALKLLTGFNSVAVLPKSTPAVLASLTLLTQPFSTIPGINWVYWSLTCEIFYYAAVCLVIAIRLNLQIPFLVLISLAAILVPTHARGPLFILKNWTPFAIGVAVYFISEQKNKLPSFILLTVSFAALIKDFLLNKETPYFIATVFAAVLIAISLKYKLKNNIFSKLGDFSYSVYLLHVPIGAFVLLHYKTLPIQQNIYLNISFDVACYLITFGVAYLSFKFIELPSIKAGKTFSRKVTMQKTELVDAK